MANGNISAIEIIRRYVSDEKKIPPALKDELLFGAILDLYDEIKEFRNLRPWVLGFKWGMTILGAWLLVSILAQIALLV